VRADDAFRQALDGEVFEANLAIALARGMDDDEIPWMASLAKVLFDALVERLGDTHEREAVDGQRRAVRDRGIHERVAAHAPAIWFQLDLGNVGAAERAPSMMSATDF